MGGYPYFLILIGCYIRWIFTGFRRNKLEKYLDDSQDKTNFFIALISILSIIYLIIFFKSIL